LDAVVRRVWSNEPGSYAGCSAATVRASHAGHFKGDEPDKKVYPGPPAWMLGVELETPPRKNLSNRDSHTIEPNSCKKTIFISRQNTILVSDMECKKSPVTRIIYELRNNSQ
jgi:hypothetical protein